MVEQEARGLKPEDRYSQSGDCGENAAVEWFSDVRRSEARLETKVVQCYGSRKAMLKARCEAIERKKQV